MLAESLQQGPVWNLFAQGDDFASIFMRLYDLADVDSDC